VRERKQNKFLKLNIKRLQKENKTTVWRRKFMRYYKKYLHHTNTQAYKSVEEKRNGE